MKQQKTKPEEEKLAEQSQSGDATPHAAGESESLPPSEGSPEEQLVALAGERDANHDKWMRAEAELENFRRRSQKEREELRLYQALSLARDLLPALDNLHRAVTAAENSNAVDELAQGVEMVARQFEEVLSRHAVVPIEAVGKPFDPNFHEAVHQVPSDNHPAMTILEEFERGYTLHERVVRPSKVIVSSGPPVAPQTREGEDGKNSPDGE